MASPIYPPLGEKRIAAYTFDLIAKLGIGLGSFIFVENLSSNVTKDILIKTLNDMGMVLLILIGFFFFFLYDLVKDAFPNGQSIGKKIMKIKVVDFETKNNCSLKQSIIRNLAFFIPLSTLFMAIQLLIYKKNRRIGDGVAKTMVVESK